MRSPSVAGVDIESRMFCPALDIPEDPVSGNAHGLLGASGVAFAPVVGHGVLWFALPTPRGVLM